MNRFKLLLLMLISLSSAAQIVLPPGFPDRSPNLDVLPGFKTPPTGYGNVGFYWWNGDTLTKERLLWQLDELKNKSITGLQINYCPSMWKVPGRRQDYLHLNQLPDCNRLLFLHTEMFRSGQMVLVKK